MSKSSPPDTSQGIDQDPQLVLELLAGLPADVLAKLAAVTQANCTTRLILNPFDLPADDVPNGSAQEISP